MHMAVFVDSETMSVKHLISLEKVLAESLRAAPELTPRGSGQSTKH